MVEQNWLFRSDFRFGGDSGALPASIFILLPARISGKLEQKAFTSVH
jgi:hypothetical protein